MKQKEYMKPLTEVVQSRLSIGILAGSNADNGEILGDDGTAWSITATDDEESLNGLFIEGDSHAGSLWDAWDE